MKKIKISQERWAKFRQELIPMVLLSTVQVWWCFNFPAFIRLGSPLNTIVSLISSILSVFLYFFIFSSADNYAPYSNLEYLDEVPPSHRHICEEPAQLAAGHLRGCERECLARQASGNSTRATFKNIIRISFATVFHLGIFLVWYNNLYGMSNVYYAFSYIYCLIAVALMARAANRRPKPKDY